MRNMTAVSRCHLKDYDLGTLCSDGISPHPLYTLIYGQFSLCNLSNTPATSACWDEIALNSVHIY